MAQGKLNPVFENFRGTIGDMVVKQYGSKTVLSRKPVFRDRVFSEAQKASHEKFREAALYARSLMSDPCARQFYEEEARVKGKPVRSLIIADFLHS